MQLNASHAFQCGVENSIHIFINRVLKFMAWICFDCTILYLCKCTNFDSLRSIWWFLLMNTNFVFEFFTISAPSGGLVWYGSYANKVF